MEGVPETLPDLERHVYAGGGGLFGEAGRVVKDDFVVAGVNEQGRQAVHVAVERRDERVVGGRTVAVTIGQELDAGRAQPRVPAGAGSHAVARAQQIGPGREEDGGGGHLHALVAQGKEKRQREAAPRRFAADNDSFGRVPLGQQEAVRGAGVEQAGRERIFRGEAVFGQQGAGATGGGEVGDETAMGAARPDKIAATVQVEKGRARSSVAGIEPFRGHPECVDRHGLDSRGHWQLSAARVDGFALVIDWAVKGKAAVAPAKEFFEQAAANTWHCRDPHERRNPFGYRDYHESCSCESHASGVAYRSRIDKSGGRRMQ